MNTTKIIYELKLDQGVTMKLTPQEHELEVEHVDKNYNRESIRIPLTSLQFVIEHLQKIVEDVIVEKL